MVGGVAVGGEVALELGHLGRLDGERFEGECRWRLADVVGSVMLRSSLFGREKLMTRNEWLLTCRS